MGPGPSEAPTPRMVLHRAPYKPPYARGTRPDNRDASGFPNASSEATGAQNGNLGLFRVMPGPDTATVWTRGKQAAQPIGLLGDTTPTLRIASAADRRPEPKNSPSLSLNRRLATGWRRGKLVGSKLNGATGAAAPAPPNGQSER